MILTKDMQGLTPLLISFPYERIFALFLKALNPSQLLTSTDKAFLDSPSLYLHMLYRINDQDVLKKVLQGLKPNQLYAVDSNNNTLLHYASYYRNTALVRIIATSVKLDYP